jgi:hypothetical protein
MLGRYTWLIANDDLFLLGSRSGLSSVQNSECVWVFIKLWIVSLGAFSWRMDQIWRAAKSIVLKQQHPDADPTTVAQMIQTVILSSGVKSTHFE